MYSFDYVKEFDPVVAKAMEDELQRQRNNIELIASENLVSRAVMEAMGSHLTNKYAEGYPGKRYYGGCQCVDVAENLAIARAKELFGGSPFIKCRIRVFPTPAVVAGQAPKDSERTFLLQYAKNRIHPCLRRTKIRNVSQYMEPLLFRIPHL